MNILNSIINNSINHLHLLSSTIFQIIDTCLSPPIPPDFEIRLFALNVLTSYCSSSSKEVNDACLIPFHSILFRLNDMASLNDTDEVMRNKTRHISLIAIKALISTKLIFNLNLGEFKNALNLILPSLVENLLPNSNKLDVLHLRIEPQINLINNTTIEKLENNYKDNEKSTSPSENDLAVISFISLKLLCQLSDGFQLANVIVPTFNSLDKNKRWRDVPWALYISKFILNHSQIQYRYFIPITLINMLDESWELFPATTKQSGLLHILSHLFKSDLTINGLQVNDVLGKLLNFAINRLIRDVRDALLPLLVNVCASLGHHIYYSDQINDMCNNVINRIDNVDINDIRDDIIRFYLSVLSGILSVSYDGPPKHLTSSAFQSNPNSPLPSPPCSPKGKEKAFIFPTSFKEINKSSNVIGMKRSRLSPISFINTISLLIEPEYAVRASYVKSLAAYIEGEMQTNLSLESEVEFEKFINGLNASIYTLATCKNLADGFYNINYTSPDNTNNDNKKLVKSLEILKKVNTAFNRKPSSPENTATPSDFSAILAIIISLHRRDAGQALITLVPLLRALEQHAVHVLLGPGLQSDGSRRGSLASWSQSPKIKNKLIESTVDERVKFKALREVIARSWFEIGERWNINVIKDMSVNGLNKLGSSVLSSPPEFDFNEEPGFTLPPPVPVLFPSEEDWDEIHDGESSKTGQSIIDLNIAIDMLSKSEQVQLETKLDESELKNKLSITWTFERAIELASTHKQQKFLIKDIEKRKIKNNEENINLSNVQMTNELNQSNLSLNKRKLKNIGVNDLKEALETGTNASISRRSSARSQIR